MNNTISNRIKASTSLWSSYVRILASAVFFSRLGSGLLSGIATNFYVDILGLSGKEVLWLAGIREIPGLALVFIAALIMHWPLSRRAGISLILMGLGYGLYATVQSYLALIAVALIGSVGFHNWAPMQSALGMGLTDKAHSGRVLGFLASMGSLAAIVGMGLSAALASSFNLRTFYAIGGVLMVVGGILVFQIPVSIGKQSKPQPRFFLHKRYWLYYVLTFFEGSRMQVFGAFNTLVLVQQYGLNAGQISLILLLSSVVNFIFAPRLGHLLDSIGERLTLTSSYVVLALCFIGYATVHNVWFLSAMLICINLMVALRIGLSTYVNRIAPPDELAPTLTAGVSINHITSVSMSFLAGILLSIVGYEWLSFGAAMVIFASVPFAMAIKTQAVPKSELQIQHT
ncbi:MAG: MFS transporter [Anaerolineae bacterium]|nr:MFS transporter [Anaerolineae bacterium]